MNAENPQEDKPIHPAVYEVMDWAWEIGDLIPALNALMFADSMEVGGPDLILPVPSREYSALLIWIHDGEGLNEDQEKWFRNYCRLIESGGADPVYRVFLSNNYMGVTKAIKVYLQLDFDEVTVH